MITGERFGLADTALVVLRYSRYSNTPLWSLIGLGAILTRRLNAAR
jgi:hypothetical protein